MPRIGIGLGLRSIMGALLDPDASAYIAAIESQGSTVTGAQRTAVSEFISAEKSASRWTGLKRFYLPVWGVAAANAICMKSLTSGTFVGGVTHGAGFVQGNGSTGYFNSSVALNSILSTGSCSIFDLVRDDIQFYTGGYLAPIYEGLAVGDTSLNIYGNAPSDATAMTAAATAGGGIIVASQTATAARGLYQRLAAGFSTLVTNTTSDTNALPAINMYFAGGFNNNGGLLATANRHGAYGMSEGMNAANVEAFTLNLKTLWETVTGLTLP